MAVHMHRVRKRCANGAGWVLGHFGPSGVLALLFAGLAATDPEPRRSPLPAGRSLFWAPHSPDSSPEFLMDFTCTATSPPERFALLLARHGRFDEPSFLAARGRAGEDLFSYAYAAAIARETVSVLKEDETPVLSAESVADDADFLGSRRPAIERFATGLSHLRLDTATFAVDLLRERLCRMVPEWADGSKLAKRAAKALCDVFDEEAALPQGHKALCVFLLSSGNNNFVARAVARRSVVSSEQQSAAISARAAVAHAMA